LETLFSEFIGLQNEELEFHAALNGIDISKEKDKKASDFGIDTSNVTETVPLFGDPAEYENMNSEEKQSMTEKMKRKHKNWSS